MFMLGLGQGPLDPELLKTFWIPAFAGMTEKGFYWSHKMMLIMKPLLLRGRTSLDRYV